MKDRRFFTIGLTTLCVICLPIILWAEKSCYTKCDEDGMNPINYCKLVSPCKTSGHCYLEYLPVGYSKALCNQFVNDPDEGCNDGYILVFTTTYEGTCDAGCGCKLFANQLGDSDDHGGGHLCWQDCCTGS